MPWGIARRRKRAGTENQEARTDGLPPDGMPPPSGLT